MNNKQILVIVIAINLFFSCIDKTVNPDTDSAARAKQITSDIPAVSLADTQFDIAKFEEGNEIMKGKLVNTNEMKDLHLNQIDKIDRLSDYPGIKYYNLKELHNGLNGKILVLSRVSEMEMYAWLVSYSPDGHLIDFKTVFYDEFAEGFESITSKIEENKIKINHSRYDFENEKDSVSTQTFYIDKSLKFALVQ